MVIEDFLLVAGKSRYLGLVNGLYDDKDTDLCSVHTSCFITLSYYIHPVQIHSLLLVAALWYDPSAQTQTLHHLNPPVSTKSSTLHSVTVTQQPSLFGCSYSQRLCNATLVNASLPPAASPSTTIRPPPQLKTGHFAESAHRQYYLISIELFQMKSEGVSHSPGLFCVLVQCVGSLLWFIRCQCGSFAAGSLNHRCSLAPAPRENG